jgi:hypothetical protein
MESNMIRNLILTSIFTVLLSSCGYVKLRPYGQLEVYQLVPGKFHLRIPYLQTSRGNPHGLLLANAKKNKDYIAGRWYVVNTIDGEVGLTDYNAETNCPYGNHHYPNRLVRGTFSFNVNSVTVNLQRYNGPVVIDENEWYNHEFNGRYEVRKLNAFKESEYVDATDDPYYICPNKPKEEIAQSPKEQAQ